MAAEHPIAISVLGTPSIERDGRAVRFETRKAVALLAYLALDERPHRRESLAALLWPDADETHARSALRRTLSVLKQGLGDGVLEVSRDALAVVPTAVTVDVRSFLAGLASDDLEDVVAAAALWRGDLLEGFTLRDSPPFDEWQRRQAEYLRRVFGATLARVVDGWEAAGRIDEALGLGERWLALDPLHEPAHRALMRLHAHRGDRAASVRQYRACMRIVEEELGVAPLEETTALHEAIAVGAIPTVSLPPSQRSAPAPSAAAAAVAADRYPFVGRTVEVARLEAALGPRRVVVVEGEPGVGKSRLVEEVLGGLGTQALFVRCYDHDGDVPYGPLVELLRQAAAEPARRAAIEALPVACRAEASRLVPELLPPTDGQPVVAPHGPGAEARFLDSIARVVGAACSAPPGVVVVDDAQWADHASQQVLAHLMHRAGDSGPCLVVTIRSGEVPDAGPLAHALADRQRGGGGESIRLHRLEPGAVAELVARVAADAGTEISEEVRDEVQRESEGLPFLVVAYLDSLSTGAGRMVAVGDLLGSRLSALSDEAAQVLAAASVIGRSFSFDVVRVASGRSDDEAVAALDELLARGLIAEQDTRRGPAYDFAHGQVRQFVYDGISLARRRLLHHRAAEALLAETGPAADAAAEAATVAHHLRLAGSEQRAAEYCRRAGDHARDVYANTEALAQYDAALALGHPAVAELREAIGDLQVLDGRFAAAVASYEQAASRLGPEHAHRLSRKLGGVQQRRGQWSTAERHYADALAALGPHGPASVRATITADLAITAHRLGESARAGELAATAVDLAATANDTGALAHTGTVAGLLAVHRGDPSVARGLLDRSLELAEQLGDLVALAAAANGLARVELAGGDLRRAEDLLIRALTACVEIGDRHREAALRDQLAHVVHRAGRTEDAMDELKRAVAIFADIGVEDGSVQTEVWRLSEWVDQALDRVRNDLGTPSEHNVTVASRVSADGRSNR